MTIDLLIRHVDDSIAKAERGDSAVDVGVLGIRGFSTGTQRRLINNLCRMPKENPVYLECGLYAGATFCAAINNNPSVRATGIENFSQDFGINGIRDELFANLAKYRSSPMVQIVEGDCFAVNTYNIYAPIDLFYFDGEHSEESQARALPYFFGPMADLFFFIVDDWQWQSVRDGTNRGFRELLGRMIIHRTWILDEGVPDSPKWHNGTAIFLCEKV